MSIIMRCRTSMVPGGAAVADGVALPIDRGQSIPAPIIARRCRCAPGALYPLCYVLGRGRSFSVMHRQYSKQLTTVLAVLVVAAVGMYLFGRGSCREPCCYTPCVSSLHTRTVWRYWQW